MRKLWRSSLNSAKFRIEPKTLKKKYIGKKSPNLGTLRVFQQILTAHLFIVQCRRYLHHTALEPRWSPCCISSGCGWQREIFNNQHTESSDSGLEECIAHSCQAQHNHYHYPIVVISRDDRGQYESEARHTPSDEEVPFFFIVFESCLILRSHWQQRMFVQSICAFKRFVPRHVEEGVVHAIRQPRSQRRVKPQERGWWQGPVSNHFSVLLVSSLRTQTYFRLQVTWYASIPFNTFKPKNGSRISCVRFCELIIR